MKIKSAVFVISNTDLKKCPEPNKAEYAFIGRSNVGKSSLINYLCNNKKLAKTSSTPGKTQLINHFLINEEWYLVDLPGYGYAKSSKKLRRELDTFVFKYLKSRSNLLYTFVLLDARHEPQKIDLDFMEWMGRNGLPFVMVFTKTDKININILNKNLAIYKEEMLKIWEELPLIFTTSSTNKTSGDVILKLIQNTNQEFTLL